MNNGYRLRRSQWNWSNILVIAVGATVLGYFLYTGYQASQEETALYANCKPTNQKVYVGGYVSKVLVVYECPDIGVPQ